jgi:hypothetical protein
MHDYGAECVVAARDLVLLFTDLISAIPFGIYDLVEALDNANLRLLSHASGNGWLPAQKEHLAANPTSAMALLRAKL